MLAGLHKRPKGFRTFKLFKKRVYIKISSKAAVPGWLKKVGTGSKRIKGLYIGRGTKTS